VFFPVLEVSLVLAAIGIDLQALAIGFVISPISGIAGSVGLVGKLSGAMESIVSKATPVEGPIGVDEDAVIEIGHALLERSLVVDAVATVDLPCTVRASLLPLTIVETARHGYQLVRGEFFSSDSRDSLMNEPVLRLSLFIYW
jgi:hypothetical protein